MKRLVIAIQSLLSKKKLTGERVFLRPPKRRDALKWQKLRMSSKSFLVPWEPSWDASSCTRRAYLRYFKNSNYLANMDRAYSFLIFKIDLLSYLEIYLISDLSLFFFISCITPRTKFSVF